MTRPLSLSSLFLGLLFSCAAPVDEEVSGEELGQSSVPETDVERFRFANDYYDEAGWFTLEVSRSVVTETRRRIYVDKGAVTQALLEHRGGEGKEAAPMLYEQGTLFVAESLNEDGTVRDTEVLRVTEEGPPEFLLFDGEGRRSDTFAQPNDPPGGPRPGNVPQVCIGCHVADNFFDPMMSFPTEPQERVIEIDARYRNLEIVTQFLEGYHRGRHLFGPYGAIWLSTIKADLDDGTLPRWDRYYADMLSLRYSEVLGIPPFMDIMETMDGDEVPGGDGG